MGFNHLTLAHLPEALAVMCCAMDSTLMFVSVAESVSLPLPPCSTWWWWGLCTNTWVRVYICVWTRVYSRRAVHYLHLVPYPLLQRVGMLCGPGSRHVVWQLLKHNLIIRMSTRNSMFTGHSPPSLPVHNFETSTTHAIYIETHTCMQNSLLLPKL